MKKGYPCGRPAGHNGIHQRSKDNRIARSGNRMGWLPTSFTSRRLLSMLKVELGCSQCGYNKHPEALDFDHRDPTQKARSVSSLASDHGLSAWSAQRLLAEIEKCDVLCANCHRVKSKASGDIGPRKKISG